MKIEEIIKMLPEEYEKACWETKAMSRKRGLQKEKDLLILCLFYAYDHTLIEVQNYAQATGIGKISDVGFMKRFSRCTDWFKWINQNIAPEEVIHYEKPELLKDYQVLAVDASDIMGKGAVKQKWHLHYAVDIFSMSCEMYELTPETTGETLLNFEFRKNDLVLGDRIYATIKGIEYCTKEGADFILRIRNKAFKLYDESGNEIKYIDLLNNVDGKGTNFNVYYKNSDNELKPLRICAVKKSEEEIKKTKKREQRNESRKQIKCSEETKLSHNYFFVVTSLDNRFSAEQILNLYRLRWQVEMVFKRYKSILKLGCLPTKTAASSEAWLNCKMLIVLLIEKLMGSISFSPCERNFPKCMERNEDFIPLDFSGYIST